MKYKTLYNIARQIDHLIDHYMHSTGSAFIPQNELKNLILKNFPNLYIKDAGWHKIAFGIRTTDQKIVLKVGAKNIVEKDHRAYKRVPQNMRHQLYAKIYWHTKYCLLQEYGSPANATKKELDSLRRIVYRYGISDIKEENLRKFDGEIRIIDANATPFPLPTVWKMVDKAKPKLPKQLVLFTKKITRLLYDK
ncbi:MAG TPA: hypothetical protein VK253_02720 [Candidatus Binatia bacterium]|nr:hypothetical protein [Candidatus Binatia bacterium]